MEPKKRISFDIPESLHRNFKLAMVDMGADIKKFLTDYIEQTVQDYEKRKLKEYKEKSKE